MIHSHSGQKLGSHTAHRRLPTEPVNALQTLPRVTFLVHFPDWILQALHPGIHLQAQNKSAPHLSLIGLYFSLIALAVVCNCLSAIVRLLAPPPLHSTPQGQFSINAIGQINGAVFSLVFVCPHPELSYRFPEGWSHLLLPVLPPAPVLSTKPRAY